MRPIQLRGACWAAAVPSKLTLLAGSRSASPSTFSFFRRESNRPLGKRGRQSAFPLFLFSEDVRRTQDSEFCGHPPKIEKGDRKSTRLNSSHLVISYAVF